MTVFEGGAQHCCVDWEAFRRTEKRHFIKDHDSRTNSTDGSRAARIDSRDRVVLKCQRSFQRRRPKTLELTVIAQSTAEQTPVVDPEPRPRASRRPIQGREKHQPESPRAEVTEGRQCAQGAIVSPDRFNPLGRMVDTDMFRFD